MRLKFGKKGILFLAASAVSGLVLAGAGHAQTNRLAMLDGLSKGEWNVRYRDGTPSRKICLKTGDELVQLQLQHSGRDCSRFVVEDESSEVTVQYTCRGDGYGRTNIRRETPVLVQVESQGIAGGLPFQFSAEARKTGECS